MKHGAVYERRGKLIVHADSKTVAGVLIGVPPYVVLEATADAAEIGRTLRSVLEHSKMDLRHPEPHEWDAVARPLYDAVGAKSWGTFARGAQLVSVVADNEMIRLHPQENRGARDGFQPMGLPVIEVSATVSDDQLGLAIREALGTASAREHAL
jgi:hypothetical protein